MALDISYEQITSKVSFSEVKLVQKHSGTPVVFMSHISIIAVVIKSKYSTIYSSVLHDADHRLLYYDKLPNLVESKNHSMKNIRLIIKRQ